MGHRVIKTCIKNFQKLMLNITLSATEHNVVELCWVA